MPRRARHEHACPFIDRNDPRCAHRFSLNRMNQAFTVCLNEYRTCPMYRQLSREREAPRDPQPYTLTLEGRPLDRLTPAFGTAALALRPTGS